MSRLHHHVTKTTPIPSFFSVSVKILQKQLSSTKSVRSIHKGVHFIILSSLFTAILSMELCEAQGFTHSSAQQCQQVCSPCYSPLQKEFQSAGGGVGQTHTWCTCILDNKLNLGETWRLISRQKKTWWYVISVFTACCAAPKWLKSLLMV